MANPYGYPGSYPSGNAIRYGQEVVEPPYLTRDDAEHLNLLRIGYYVTAAFSTLVGLFPLLYVGLGMAMANGWFATSSSKGAPPPFIGWFMIGAGVVAFTAINLMAVCSWLAAKALRERRRRTLLLVVASAHLMHAPLGTLLGVFSLLVLSRPSVRATFDTNDSGLATGQASTTARDAPDR